MLSGVYKKPILIGQRPPAPVLPAARVHGDPAVEGDDLAAAAGGRPLASASQQPVEGPAGTTLGGPCPPSGRLAGRLWDFCGDLDGVGYGLCHECVSSCVTAGER